MDRRHFVRLVLAGGSAGFIVPSALAAAVAEQASMAGGVYYTQDAPGRWAGKVKTHLPLLEVKPLDGGRHVQIVTPHEMKGYEHYIIKHILLDKNFKFLNEKLFDPNKDSSPISHFPLGDYHGTLYALSVCNLHDSWLNSADV